MPDPEILPPANPPAIRRAEDDEKRYRICDGCGCTLTRRGEIVSLGERYKTFQKHDRTVDELNTRIADLEKEARDLRVKVAELTPAAREKGSNLLI